MFTTFKKKSELKDLKRESESPEQLKRKHKSMVNKLFQNKYIESDEGDPETHLSRRLRLHSQTDARTGGQSEFRPKFMPQSEPFNLSEFQHQKQRAYKPAPDNFTSINQSLINDSKWLDLDKSEEPASRCSPQQSKVFVRKKKANRQQIDESSIEFSKANGQSEPRKKVVSPEQSQAEDFKSRPQDSGGLAGPEPEQSSTELSYESKQNSVMLFIQNEPKMVQKLGRDLRGVNFRGTDHSREHMLRIEQLSRQGHAFDDRVKQCRKKMKETLRHYKLIGKNLLASYQTTTLSHLIISLMEKDSNFEDIFETNFLYSLNKRKINLSYFEKRPKFKQIAEHWENNLISQL